MMKLFVVGVIFVSTSLFVNAHSDPLQVCKLENSEKESTLEPILELEILTFLKMIRCGPIQIAKFMNKLTEDKTIYLNRLATRDVVLSDVSFDKLWEKSPINKRNKWIHNNKSCVLFWENYQHLSDLKVVKLQSAMDRGTCHAQAAVTTHHYVTSINRNVDENVGMVDVPSLLRHQLNSCGKLELYLSGEYEGGNSLHALKLIAGLASEDVTTLPVFALFSLHKIELCELIMDRLKVQPALPSYFQVTEDFMHSLKVSFSAADISVAGKELGRHAMVLVGMRRDENDQFWFLVQNWWADKPFVEISFEYMQAMGGQLTFVDKKIVDIPSIGRMKKTHFKALQTAVDIGDNFYGEK